MTAWKVSTNCPIMTIKSELYVKVNKDKNLLEQFDIFVQSDMLLTVPSKENIKKGFPHVYVTLICPKRTTRSIWIIPPKRVRTSFIPLTFYPRRDSRDISDILWDTHFLLIWLSYEKYCKHLNAYIKLKWSYEEHIHTYIPLTLYPRRGSRGISNIPPRYPHFTKIS
jgi:hypothetical protein